MGSGANQGFQVQRAKDKSTSANQKHPAAHTSSNSKQDRRLKSSSMRNEVPGNCGRNAIKKSIRLHYMTRRTQQSYLLYYLKSLQSSQCPCLLHSQKERIPFLRVYFSVFRFFFVLTSGYVPRQVFRSVQKRGSL